jgi:succinylarginine dihydrolase
VQVFVYGRDGLVTGENEPVRYPARQTRLASDAVARLHQLSADRTVFVQQNPEAIDRGVFHNDVISVSNRNVLFHHQQAFANSDAALDEIRRKMAALELDFHPIEVPQAKVSIDDAVATYLFNSQLLSKNDGKMMIVVPEESRQHSGVWDYLCELQDSGGPINQVEVFDLRESMRNGGGPACLRLRVALNRAELAAVNDGSLMNDALFARLNQWVDSHYRDRMHAEDLADPQLLTEVRYALDELTQILGLGVIYPFQR